MEQEAVDGDRHGQGGERIRPKAGFPASQAMGPAKSRQTRCHHRRLTRGNERFGQESGESRVRNSTASPQ